MTRIHTLFLLFVIILSISNNTITAATQLSNVPEGQINWVNIDQSIAETKSSNKKFILVDLYTDWCGWCKKMDEGTYTEASIVSLINANFTAVKFNAEQQNPIVFNGKSYSFLKSGPRGTHQLALELGGIGGKLGYPTLVVLDANGNKLETFPGYKDVETMTAILKYFQTGSYKNMDFQQYESGQ